MQNIILSISFVFLTYFGLGQYIVDSCFSSTSVGSSFPSSADLINSTSSDLLTYDGINWSGALPNANVTIPPPSGSPNCRVIFLGNGITWTSGGEGFGVRLTSPLIAGQIYNIPITYVSHGEGSDGNFSPLLFSLNSTLTSANYIGSLPGVGNVWTTNVFSFIATISQSGDTWLIFRSGNGSTGLISSFCKSCVTPPNCSIELGPNKYICSQDTLTLTPNSTTGSIIWQDGSNSSTYQVTEPGLYSVSISYGSCVEYDSIYIYQHNSVTAKSEGKDCSCHLYIPNSFTPNDDEFNSTFGPILDCIVDVFLFTVYDRWGQKVFESNDSNVFWDGTFLNQSVPIGIYIYTLRYRYAEQSETNFKSGHLNVL